jgi:antitoxin component YwqK of YwqJK toxin-antitoxin module
MNQKDDKGQKQGYWEYFSYGDILWSKGNYIDDLEEGYWEQYYPDGNPWYKGNFINGKENGYWEYFNFLGNLVEKEFHL